MRSFRTLAQDEARRAMAAGLAEAQTRSLQMAFAVADCHGDLILCERMDGAPARVLQQAIRKAYTAARMGRDTAVFAQQLRERQGDLAQWGDPGLTTLTGGVAAIGDGGVLGGVACGGAPTQIDAEIAALMTSAALQASLA